MQARERRIQEGYGRVVKFLADYPAADPQLYAEPKAQLQGALEDLIRNATTETALAHQSQGARSAVDAAIRQLRVRHLRPLVSIAKAHRAQLPGIEKALVMPKASMPVSTQLMLAEAIRETVERYGPVFVKFGRPADFRDQLSAAIALVEEAAEVQAVMLRDKAGARRAVEDAVRRGRDAVTVLDSAVRIAFDGQGDTLRKWEVAKRIKQLPVRTDGGSPEQDEQVIPIAA